MTYKHYFETLACHSYWAEATSYSVDTRNLIPSRRHPMKIPLESLTGKCQNISHLRVFGAKCWAKIPTVHRAQVTGGSKLDPRAVECRFLGYAGSRGNYKVQDVTSCGVFVSRDIIFEEGEPHCTSPSVGENIPLFNVAVGTLDESEVKESGGVKENHDQHADQQTDQSNQQTDQSNIVDNPVGSGDQHVDKSTGSFSQTDIPQTEPIQQMIRRSSPIPQPSTNILQSNEYQQREELGRRKGEEWTNDRRQTHTRITIDELLDAQDDYVACLAETKASHNIPHSYRHAMSTDPERWIVPMQVEMDTLKCVAAKQTEKHNTKERTGVLLLSSCVG